MRSGEAAAVGHTAAAAARSDLVFEWSGPRPGKRPRFASLDMFRGLTIIVMIVVNTPGPGADEFATLDHAPWIGFTLADIVFPSFLFAIGNAMSFSMRWDTRPVRFIAAVAKRAAIIFVLGFLMYWWPFVTHGAEGWLFNPLAETRIPGVLQRIALCYFLAALAVRWLPLRPLAVLGIALLAAHWAILEGASAPGMAFDKFGNAGTRLDLFLIGPAHLYRKDHGFDPEGLLGTMPAITSIIVGYLTGRFVQISGRTRRTVLVMTVAGLGLAASGLALAPVLPIAKKLWTGSYVLLTGGIDLVLLAGLIELVELRNWRFGVRFLQIVGRNPLAVYLFSELFLSGLHLIEVAPAMDPYQWLGITVFQAIAPGPIGSLLCAISYTMVCWLVGWALDRRGLILKA